MKKSLALVIAAASLAVAAVAYAQSFPEDIVYQNGLVGNTTFSHASHAGMYGIGCQDCHKPDGFAYQRGASDINMTDMNAGKNCGECHIEGGMATPADQCSHCHND